MRAAISQLVTAAIASAIEDGALTLTSVPDPELERPRDRVHGDWATSVALRSAKSAARPPREVAEIIATRIAESPDIASVEVAGPGFINLRLSSLALQRVLREARTQGSGFGRVDEGRGRRVQVEFVSANPVGPMHVGHGRWAALGDSMARVLAHAGWEVQREFYINDAGVQMDIFAKSVSARYMQLCGRDASFPEDGYRGAYIGDIAREIREAEGDVWAGVDASLREAHFKETAYAAVLAHLKRVLHEMGVDFDVWFSERTLHEPQAGTGNAVLGFPPGAAPGAEPPPGLNAIDSAIETLRTAGYVYEHEGATWFRSTDFGDDKDRVLRKSDGEYTYFAADIAYHKDKYSRGFDRVIDIWGADHHGYVKRMEAAVAALGYPGRLDIVIGQLVNLFRNGEAVRMSKRTGEMVTFEDLLDEVGPDAARYFFLRRSTDQPLDFDIGLAKEQSAENPVYYVQYAHARICAILRKGVGADTADESVDIAATAAALISPEAPIELLDSEPELVLMRKLAEFSEVVEMAARDLAPHKLTRYAEDLAAAFHQFYTQCRVVDPAEPELTAARLYAVDAARIALEGVLSLVGVSAPQRM